MRLLFARAVSFPNGQLRAPIVFKGLGHFVAFAASARVVGSGLVSKIKRLTRDLPIAFVIVCHVAIVACGGKKPPVVVPPPRVEVVEVQVPTPFKVQPPPELLLPFKIPLPVFVAPSDPEASSALTVENERLLRGLIEELLQRLAAWKAWAEAK